MKPQEREQAESKSRREDPAFTGRLPFAALYASEPVDATHIELRFSCQHMREEQTLKRSRSSPAVDAQSYASAQRDELHCRDQRPPPEPASDRSASPIAVVSTKFNSVRRHKLQRRSWQQLSQHGREESVMGSSFAPLAVEASQLDAASRDERQSSQNSCSIQ